ncbi:MAG: hypothetical protein M0R21_04025 [Lentimicrobiaceae bacterium]|nr:hypothetical protein [Lentimicrobiaceae bacterium]
MIIRNMVDKTITKIIIDQKITCPFTSSEFVGTIPIVKPMKGEIKKDNNTNGIT